MSRRTIDVKDLAKELGTSKNATYEAIKRGDIPAIRVGRRLLVPGDWLDRKLEAMSSHEAD